MIEHLPCGVDFRRHVRQHVLDGLKPCDGLSELNPFPGIIDAQFQELLGRTQGTGPHGQAPLVQNAHGGLEPFPDHGFAPDDIFHGDPALVEDQLTGVAAAQSHFALDGPRIKAGGVSFHHKGGNPAPCLFLFVRYRDDGGEISDVAVGDEMFQAV